MFRRKRKPNDFSDEIESHIQLEAERLREQGLSAEDARAAASRAFGNVTQAEERFYESRRWLWFDHLWQDLRFSFRMLRKSPGFTAVAVLTLALGIGVNTSFFSLLDALLLRPLPVRDPYQLITFLRGGDRPCSYPEYLDFRDRNQVLSGLAVDVPNETAIDVGDSSEVTMVDAVSYNYADVLGTVPALGRWFSQEDERLEPGEFQIVISYRLWQTRYGGDSEILGKQLRLESQPYTIIGVADKNVQGMSPPILTDVWVPLAAYARHSDFAARVMRDRLEPDVLLFGRLKAGISLDQASAAMNIIDRSLQAEYVKPESRDEPLRAEIARGISDPDNRRNVSQLATFLAAVVATILVIGCANVANLLLAQGFARRREMAIRSAVGASRARIVRQSLVESLLLVSFGTIVGFFVAELMNRYLEARIASAPVPIVIGIRFALDWRVLAFACAATVVTTLSVGILPALQTSKPDLVPALRGEASTERSRHRWFAPRNLCVLAQITVSVVLSIVSGLFVRALRSAITIDPGFDANRILAVRIYLAQRAFSDIAGMNFYHQALDTVREMPGVADATLSYDSPLISSSECVAVPNQGHEEVVLTAPANTVGTHYFHTLGIPLAGREFTSTDIAGSPSVAIVSDVLARKYFPGRSPLGMRVRVGQGCTTRGEGSEVEIVGVAKDAQYGTLAPDPKPYIFFPIAQRYGRYTSLLVRGVASPVALGSMIRRKLLDLDSRVRVYEVIGLKEQMDDSLWQVRWETGLVTAFGGLALILAAIGLYGVIASVVTQRTPEIGLRMALGARNHQVLFVILENALGLTVVGIAAGLAVALALTRFLRGLLYGLSPTDPVSFACVCVLWFVIALAASYVPARRVMRIDPMVALRRE